MENGRRRNGGSPLASRVSGRLAQEVPAALRGWLLNEPPACRCSAATWLEKGESTFFITRRGFTLYPCEAQIMKVLIGVDPHKGSHAAVAIDGEETQLGLLKVRATRAQVRPATRLGGDIPGPALGHRVGCRSRLPAGPAARRGRRGRRRRNAHSVGAGASLGVVEVEQE
jgi:hypothetical protein